MRLKALEQRGKRLLMAALRPILRARSVSVEQVSRRQLNRVLVVRQDERLGNLLLVIPLFEALRKTLPRASIAAVVSSRFAAILQGNPHIDEIVSFDKRQLLRRPLRLVSLILALRNKAYDLAIDCGPIDDLSFNNSLLTFLSGAPLRLGHLRGNSRLFLNIQVPPVTGQRSEVDRHLDVLRHLFGSIPDGQMKVYLSPEERQQAGQRRRQWGMRDEDLVLGLHVGGRGGKRWPAERFLALAEKLVADSGTRVILFWGPDESEIAEQFRERSLPRLFISPLLSIRELAAQLEQCTAMICGDTGPMHLARAVGTPTVAIFLVANYERYGHGGPRSRIVYSPGGDLTVDHVYGAVQDLIAQLAEESALS